jgi:DNA-binding transcriptional ArsR family regulator
METLSENALRQVAEFFKALGEPRRLKLLNELRAGEKNVGELVELTQTSQANVSKHLAVLSQKGIVEREQRGNCVYYRIADQSTFELCDLVCGQLMRKVMSELEWQREFATLGQDSDERRDRG